MVNLPQLLPADKQMASRHQFLKSEFLRQSNHDWLIPWRVGFKTKKPTPAEQA
jgi:hypothetical protein